MAAIKIDVTVDDIAHGVRSNCWECPVSRAIQRALPHLRVVAVGTYNVDMGSDVDQTACVQLPESARKFIAAFDGGEAAEPLAFKMDVPDSLAKLAEAS